MHHNMSRDNLGNHIENHLKGVLGEILVDCE
jgi:hypothetical protein